MKYYYQLDTFNRFIRIGLIKEDETDSEIELESIQDIQVGYHGIVNEEVVFIGAVESELIKTNEDLILDIQIKINNLRESLLSTDYKVFKCLEAKDSEEPLPYDFETLKAQRKVWREEINILETQKSEIETS